MQVPGNPWRCALRGKARRRRGCGVWALCAVLVAAGVVASARSAIAGEKKNAPWVQFPLEALGIPAVSNVFLSSGSSMLTVHFLDSSHLFVTYSERTLVPRIAGDSPDHDDRVVAGEVVDLPSGHIDARTTWYMHDHGRYLWSLGGGRFLLRIGDQLYTMAPLANLGTAEPFERALFPSRQVRPSLVFVSPDGAIVTTETILDAPGEDGRTRVILGDTDTAEMAKSKTLIDFYRIEPDDRGKKESATARALPDVERAGSVQSPEPLLLPVNADGYLWAQEVDANVWATTFDGYSGKTIDLGKLASSCRPRLQMVSRSEFLAMTCQGGDDRIKVASYGLDGKETWEEQLGDFGAPTFVYAPEASRFAVSHTSVGDPTPVAGSNLPAEGPRQEVRVYQNASGDMLLKVECTPVFKTAENFDLAADGTMLVVVREGAIAVYKLPPLTKRDREDMAEVAKFAPPASLDPVVLRRLISPAERKRAEAAVTAPVSVPIPAAMSAVDSTSTGVRKPPTLLKPGEKPEFGSANEPQTN
jgi:hypothetical protein